MLKPLKDIIPIIELRYIAGFFDGEGSISVTTTGDYMKSYVSKRTGLRKRKIKKNRI